MRKFIWLAAAILLGGCYAPATLDGSQVEPMTVEGRKFEIRVASTDVKDQYRLVVGRATMVVNPDYELEGDRARNVARKVMDRTCKGRPYSQEIETMQGVNYRTVFRCE